MSLHESNRDNDDDVLHCDGDEEEFFAFDQSYADWKKMMILVCCALLDKDCTPKVNKEKKITC